MEACASGTASPAACLNGIARVAAETAGTVVVLQHDTGRVLRLDSAGGIAHVGGRGGECSPSAPEPVEGALATDVCFFRPHDVAAGLDGAVYLAESAARILRIDGDTGRVAVVAGDGRTGVDECPDDVPATATCLGSLRDLAIGPNGAVYLAVDGRVRRVDPDTGLITTVAVGLNEQQCDGAGNAGDGGPARDACVAPDVIAVARDGTLAIAEGPRLRFVDADTGVITSSPYVAEPYGGYGALAFDADGDVVARRFGEPIGQVVRVRRDSDAAVVIAGNGTFASCGDDGPAIDACVAYPWDLAVDGSDVYVSEIGWGNGVRRIDARDGRITRIGDREGARGPEGRCLDDVPVTETCLWGTRIATDSHGNLFVLEEGDTENGKSDRVRRVDRATGVVTTIAGTTRSHAPSPSPGLPATEVGFELEAIEPLADGVVLLATSMRIWRVEPDSGRLALVAGRAYDPACFSCSGCGDGGPAVDACLELEDVTAAPNGDLYVASDVPLNGSSATRVRRIDAATGFIHTIAGNDRRGHAGDGGPATEASITAGRVLLEADGDLLIAGGGDVRRVDAASGVITTVGHAELGNEQSFCPDGSVSGSPCVSALALDPLGRALYVDVAYTSSVGRVRRLTLAE
jgi:hypothetical protein